MYSPANEYVSAFVITSDIKKKSEWLKKGEQCFSLFSTRIINGVTLIWQSAINFDLVLWFNLHIQCILISRHPDDFIQNKRQIWRHFEY